MNHTVDDRVSKAHKMLGMANPVPPPPPIPHSSGPSQHNGRRKPLGEKSGKSKGLHTKHSFASLGRSDKTEKGRKLDSARSEPGDAFDPRHLHPVPSSIAVPNGTSGQGLRQFASSSTLRSYYDPQKMPAAVSQQTSNSSVRDYALRRGVPPQLGPEMGTGPLEGVPLFSTPTEKSKRWKNRPSRIDLSSLFPRPRSHKNTVLSPNTVTESPSPISSGAPSFRDMISPRTPNDYRKTRGRDSSKAESIHSMSSAQMSLKNQNPYSVEGGYAKNTSRKPKPGTMNWFDNLDDDLSDEEELQVEVPPIPPMPASVIAKSKKSFPQRTSSYLNPAALNALETAMTRDGEETAMRRTSTIAGSTTSSQQHDRRSVATAATSLLSPTSDTHTTRQIRRKSRSFEDTPGKVKQRHRGNTNSSKKSAGSGLGDADLKMESMLCLSSSSDEEVETASTSKSRKASEKIPIRNSILIPQDSDVEISTATAVSRKSIIGSPRQPAPRVQSSSTMNTVIAAPSSRRSSQQQKPQRATSSRISSKASGEAVGYSPRDGSFPEETLPPKTFGERGSLFSHRENRKSMASRASDDFEVVLVASGEDGISAAFPMPNSESRRESLNMHQPNRQDSNRRSRIMSVTRQEESLLEAMRQKRAAMRQNIIREAYSNVHNDIEPSNVTDFEPNFSRRGYHNPLTTSASATSVSGASESTNPPSVVPDVHLYSEDGTGTDLSTASTRASLVMSDGFPSPSTSKASPVTPSITTHPRTSRVNDLPIAFPSPPMPLDRSRSHSRRRTDSSNALVFEDTDLLKKTSPTEDEFPVWAYTGFSRARESVTIVN